MEQKDQKPIKPWVWAIIAVVIVGSLGYLAWYFTYSKKSTTTTTSPSPTKIATTSPATSTPTSATGETTNGGGQTAEPTSNGGTGEETTNPNLASFNFNPIDSLFPKTAVISFDSLGKTVEKDEPAKAQIKQNGSILVSFNGGNSYSQGSNSQEYASAEIAILERHSIYTSSIYTTSGITLTSVAGLEAAQYTWSKGSENGISVVVSLFDSAQKPLVITGTYSNGISESDFNKVVQSVEIEK